MLTAAPIFMRPTLCMHALLQLISADMFEQALLSAKGLLLTDKTYCKWLPEPVSGVFDAETVHFVLL